MEVNSPLYILLKQTKYLNYTKIGDTGKTIVIGVGNNSGEKLGKISFSGAWRKYVFTTLTDIQLDTSCMKNIIETIEELMNQRKTKT